MEMIKHVWVDILEIRNNVHGILVLVVVKMKLMPILIVEKLKVPISQEIIVTL